MEPKIIERGNVTLRVYAQELQGGIWRGQVGVTQHHGSSVADSVVPMRETDPTYEDAMRRARNWANAEHPPEGKS